MRVVFSKSNLPLIERVVHEECTPRDNWTLMRTMIDNKSMTHQPAVELLVLERGAYRRDAWSMCQLARTRFYMANNIKGNTEPERAAAGALFAEAVSWWTKAARVSDKGACEDLKSYNLLPYIYSFKTGAGSYADIEMKCALLAEYTLTDLGLHPWHTQSEREKLDRYSILNERASEILNIKVPYLKFVSGLTLGGRIIDGCACYGDGTLSIRHELIDSYERLLQVFFHEIGHFVVFSMWNGAENAARENRSIYGITDEHAALWYDENYRHEGLPQTELDPDTLSYGVYTDWAVLFADADRKY